MIANGPFLGQSNLILLALGDMRFCDLLLSWSFLLGTKLEKMHNLHKN